MAFESFKLKRMIKKELYNEKSFYKGKILLTMIEHPEWNENHDENDPEAYEYILNMHHQYYKKVYQNMYKNVCSMLSAKYRSYETIIAHKLSSIKRFNEYYDIDFNSNKIEGSGMIYAFFYWFLTDKFPNDKNCIEVNHFEFYIKQQVLDEIYKELKTL